MGEGVSESFKDFCLSKDTLSQFWGIVSKIASEGGRYRVTIKQWREKRSISQNNLMWMWLKEIEETIDVGGEYYIDEVWHEYFKKWYCPEKRLNLPVGVIMKKSTKLLDTGEMHFYLSRIDQWSAEKMLILTTPKSSDYQKLKDKQVE